MKSSEVSIKTRSTPASLTIQGQVTKDTTVKWSIEDLGRAVAVTKIRELQTSNFSHVEVAGKKS